MEPIIHTMEQGSEEWLEVRLGKMTSSMFKTVLAKGQGKTRRKYMSQICSERCTGLPSANYTNAAMDWGTEHEAEAVARYEKDRKCVVGTVGFVELSDWIGGSPDGLVGDDGIIEVKCPNSATHYDYMRTGKVDSTYRLQIQGNLWVTGRKWCD